MTDLSEIIIPPANLWIHVVDPNDLTDSAAGSDRKILKSNLIPTTATPYVPYKGIFIFSTGQSQQFTLPLGVTARSVILEDGRFLHQGNLASGGEWEQSGRTLFIGYELENGNKLTVLN
jgi:hypothetical protein